MREVGTGERSYRQKENFREAIEDCGWVSKAINSNDAIAESSGYTKEGLDRALENSKWHTFFL